MTGRSTDRRATRRVAREEGAAGAMRRQPRKLYEAGPPAASGSAAVEPTPRYASLRGKFERRARGVEALAVHWQRQEPPIALHRVVAAADCDPEIAASCEETLPIRGHHLQIIKDRRWQGAQAP